MPRADLGILSRTDLLKVFLRADSTSDRGARGRDPPHAWIDPDTIHVVVHDGVVVMEGQLERRSLIPMVERLVMAVEGVVGIDERLSFMVDDTVAGSEISLPCTAVARR
jgi:osmotically-inducible protein OsmY